MCTILPAAAVRGFVDEVDAKAKDDKSRERLAKFVPFLESKPDKYWSDQKSWPPTFQATYRRTRKSRKTTKIDAPNQTQIFGAGRQALPFEIY